MNRRNFLKSLGIVPAIVVAPNLVAKAIAPANEFKPVGSIPQGGVISSFGSAIGPSKTVYSVHGVDADGNKVCEIVELDGTAPVMTNFRTVTKMKQIYK